MRGGRATKYGGIGYGVNGHEFNPYLQARGQRLGAPQQTTCQRRIRIWDYELNFTGESVRAQLAWIDSQLTTAFHDSRVEADP